MQNPCYFVNPNLTAYDPISNKCYPIIFPLPQNNFSSFNIIGVNNPLPISTWVSSQNAKFTDKSLYGAINSQKCSLNVQETSRNNQIKKVDEHESIIPQRKLDPIFINSIDFPVVQNEEFPTQVSTYDANKSLRGYLKDITNFILKNFGALSKEEFVKEKLRYRNRKELLVVFDVVLDKYLSKKQTKEELATHIFREALNYMETKEDKRMKNKKSDIKIFSILEKRNFRTFLQDMINQMGERYQNDKLIEFASKEYLKSTKFNEKIILEAFTSEDFCQEYKRYLTKFDIIFDLKNQKKTEKFVRTLENCIKKNKIKDIIKMKGFPWLKIWIDQAKGVAHELFYVAKNRYPQESSQIIKKEEHISELERFSQNSLETKVETNSF